MGILPAGQLDSWSVSGLGVGHHWNHWRTFSAEPRRTGVAKTKKADHRAMKLQKREKWWSGTLPFIKIVYDCFVGLVDACAKLLEGNILTSGLTGGYIWWLCHAMMEKLSVNGQWQGLAWKAAQFIFTTLAQHTTLYSTFLSSIDFLAQCTLNMSFCLSEICWVYITLLDTAGCWLFRLGALLWRSGSIGMFSIQDVSLCLQGPALKWCWTKLLYF